MVVLLRVCAGHILWLIGRQPLAQGHHVCTLGLHHALHLLVLLAVSQLAVQALLGSGQLRAVRRKFSIVGLSRL